jgi:hypothetical protein
MMAAKWKAAALVRATRCTMPDAIAEAARKVVAEVRSSALAR